MYVLYEDSGSFKAEKIFSESDSTLQVEAESGKRSGTGGIAATSP